MQTIDLATFENGSLPIDLYQEEFRRVMADKTSDSDSSDTENHISDSTVSVSFDVSGFRARGGSSRDDFDFFNLLIELYNRHADSTGGRPTAPARSQIVSELSGADWSGRPDVIHFVQMSHNLLQLRFALLLTIAPGLLLCACALLFLVIGAVYLLPLIVLTVIFAALAVAVVIATAIFFCFFLPPQRRIRLLQDEVTVRSENIFGIVPGMKRLSDNLVMAPELAAGDDADDAGMMRVPPAAKFWLKTVSLDDILDVSVDVDTVSQQAQVALVPLFNVHLRLAGGKKPVALYRRSQTGSEIPRLRWVASEVKRRILLAVRRRQKASQAAAETETAVTPSDAAVSGAESDGVESTPPTAVESEPTTKSSRRKKRKKHKKKPRRSSSRKSAKAIELILATDAAVEEAECANEEDGGLEAPDTPLSPQAPSDDADQDSSAVDEEEEEEGDMEEEAPETVPAAASSDDAEEDVEEEDSEEHSDSDDISPEHQRSDSDEDASSGEEPREDEQIAEQSTDGELSDNQDLDDADPLEED